MKQKAYGFTIVELLVVIVVIAILAAISIVAYTGIQDSAQDAAVQSDLRNFAGKIQEYYALEGVYPTATNTSRGPAGMTFSVNRSAYSVNMHNLIYCTSTDPGVQAFTIGAGSKSGKRFIYSSEGGLQSNVTPWVNNVVDFCGTQGFTAPNLNYTFGFHGPTNPNWRAWTE